MAQKRSYFDTSDDVSTPRKHPRKAADMLSSQGSGFSSYDNHQEIGNNWRNWSVEDLENCLVDHGLTDIAAMFKEAEISGCGLQLLTDERLKDMGLKMGQILQVNQFLLDIHCHSSIELTEDSKVFNDPIHGHIEMHPLCVKIIDTPQFQRLRFLKQLGMCYFVYPGASHNRFEHSIGVCHLAGQLVRALHMRQPELKITSVDMLCVEIAGLCHDLGHGPFSHLFDNEFIPRMRQGQKWKHEECSVRMFDYLVEKNDLRADFQKYGLTDTDMEFIKEQIQGPMTGGYQKESWPYKGRTEDKSYLYEIVANRRNGVDVDKWDYFARDCHMLGIKNNFDHTRFMKFARVVRVEDRYQICVRDKEVGNLYDMFYTRNALHRRAYQHKVTKILDAMMCEALIKANDFIFFPGKDGHDIKMSECIDDMEAYTNLTDNVFHQILLSKDPGLKESQKILRNIQTRNLYKCVGQSRPFQGFSVKNRDLRLEILNAMLPEDRNAEIGLSLEDIVVHLVYLDYGMKDKNPVDFVRFYEKNNVNVAVQLRKDQVSQLLPEKFAEQLILVYCKDANPEKLGIASRCFNHWCEINQMESPKKSGFELTPWKKKESVPTSPATPFTPNKRLQTNMHESAGKFRSKLFHE